MTPRALPRSRLATLVPALLDRKPLVALVPASPDVRWAARAAWDVARAATHGGRRVALVDLWLENPVLPEVRGLEPAEGIVDAFEHGISLTKATREVEGVFFIGAGIAPAQPEQLFAHERWGKLQRGFQSEGALLLLFLSPAALSRLSVVPDGILLLSPEGVDSSDSNSAAPILGVVRERWTPPAVRAPGDRDVTIPRRALAGPMVALALLVLGAAGGWQLLAKDARGHGAPVAKHRPAASRPAAPPPIGVDTVAWTIQVAAFGALPAALAVADRLTANGSPALVTPVPSEGGTVWYRVLAGFYPTREAARAARDALWEHGMVTRGEGDVLRAPYSLLLAPGTDAGSLRALGVPAARLSADGRTFIGAFESPEQATLVLTRLERGRVHATLVTRTETTP